jgi:hypothetical protein
LNDKIFFDLDGTICGQEKWENYIFNTFKLLYDFLYRPEPSNWSILTSRPIIDKPLIYLACKKYKLYPSEIITSDSIFYNFDNDYEIATWKSNVLFKKSMQYVFADRIIYVDDSIDVRSKIMTNSRIITCSTSTLEKVLLERKENGR